MKSFFRWVGILIGCVIIAAVIGVAIGKKEEFERQQAVPRVTAQKPTPPVSKPIDPAEAEREMWRRAEQRGMEQKQQREAKEKRALSAQQEAACQRIGPFARAIAELRQQGASLETAEAGAGMAISRYAGQDAAAVNNRQLKQTAFDATHSASRYVGASWTVSAQRFDLCRIFTAAFTSRSSTRPQSGQLCTRSASVLW